MLWLDNNTRVRNKRYNIVSHYSCCRDTVCEDVKERKYWRKEESFAYLFKYSKEDGLYSFMFSSIVIFPSQWHWWYCNSCNTIIVPNVVKRASSIHTQKDMRKKFMSINVKQTKRPYLHLTLLLIIQQGIRKYLTN